MTTYQHGKAPAWACATWQKWGEYLLFYEDGKRNGAYATEAAKADRICRALSLAKLAEEVAATVEAFGTDAGGFRTDWLRRYREAAR